MGCLGPDVPEEILYAGGFLPIRVCGDPKVGAEVADQYMERAFNPLVRSQFGRILDGTYSYLDYLVVSNSSDILVRAFYYLRCLRAEEPDLPIPELYFFDFLHTPYRTSALYNRERVREFLRTVESWRGRPVSQKALKGAVALYQESRQLGRKLADLRKAEPPLVKGSEALEIIGASMFMPRDRYNSLLTEFLASAERRPGLDGVRVFVTGSTQDHPYFYQMVEDCGAVIVGEDHDWGNRHLWGDIDISADDPIDAIVDYYSLRLPASAGSTVSRRVAALVEQVRSCRAQAVIFFILESDLGPGWDLPEQRRALEAMGIPVLVLDRQPYRWLGGAELRGQVEDFLQAVRGGKRQSLVYVAATERGGFADERPQTGQGTGSRKLLRSAVEASAYQREWFKNLRERVARGEPFAIVNADVPQEIFRVMDIPYVVNQWWASLCSAKQYSPYYFGLLQQRGYGQDLCRYCSLSLASAFDPEPDKGPWGGLPRPTVAVARLTCDAQAKIFDLWSRELGIPFYPLENTVPLITPEKWWEKTARDWEELFEAHRLDLMVEELKGLIRFLETTTGKTFSETRFRRIMDLINQQEEYNLLARDLIAETVPAPVSVTDQIPSVMIPQWHRGTPWAVEAAKKFYEEVRERVERGEAACPNERIRLMWLGTGLWFNLGFYQYLEQRYGAVFVWSIYLALAADGYIRYGGDPLRALASRFVGMSEMLHMPPWNTDWFLKEAKKHRIGGVVHLVSGNCPQAVEGSYFIRKRFEEAGIPVLEIRADTVDARAWDQSRIMAEVEWFIENRLGVKP
ncbi:MAG: 2-hydroxyacyl-CoA dehydratase subunit D [Moorellales bacterium]